MRHRISLVVVVATAVVVVAMGGPASAHVSLHPDTAASGAASAVLAFRVPNERADGATVGLRVQFPRDHPIVSATVRSTPGWTATVTRRPIAQPVMIEGEPVDQAVDQIEWKGGAIGVGEYQDFEITIGPLPDGTGTLVFPAIQLYDSGDPVSWIGKPNPGGPAPDHPAPTLTVSPAGSVTAESAPIVAPTSAPTPPGAPSSDSDGPARVLALVAVVLAVAGLVAAVRPRRAGRAAASPDPGWEPAGAASSSTAEPTGT
jgi:uncharacterized protein YcnI